MKRSCKLMSAIFALTVLILASAPMFAQVLTGDQLKKVVPTTFFYAGQVAPVQSRNSSGFKTSSGKIVSAGLVDNSGYATAIAEKYQGFLITETKLSLGDASVEPGAYGFGFKDGKILVMNIAGTEVASAASQNDDQVKHPVPLKFEKADGGYRLYAGKKYVVVKGE
jgi:hypothetical protein